MRVLFFVLLSTPLWPADLLRQTVEEAAAKSAGCQSAGCHAGIERMHVSPAVHLGCTDCHGGDAITTDKLKGHVQARHPEFWKSSANPVRSYTLLNQESPEYVRFRNPGDLRIAGQSCGQTSCHKDIVDKVRTSMMSHGAFLWGAALYNNGGFPLKRPVFGESYGPNGVSQKLQTVPPLTHDQMKFQAKLPELWPLAVIGAITLWAAAWMFRNRLG